MAPENTSFSFMMPVEGGSLFLPALERLWTLYPRAYARGAMSMTPPPPPRSGRRGVGAKREYPYSSCRV